jgi:two-component system chemotaxis response regulator CheY
MEPFRILLIDDSPDLRDALASQLRNFSGMEVIEADDGDIGLDRLLSEPVDLVITDYQMPTMNGRQFISAARSKGCTLPILLCSGDSQAVTEAQGVGIEAYLKSTRGLQALLSRAQTLQQAHSGLVL